jgi:hypothetical protein
MFTYGVVISHEGKKILGGFEAEDDELAFQVAGELCRDYKNSYLLSLGCRRELNKPIVIIYDFVDNMEYMFSSFF